MEGGGGTTMVNKAEIDTSAPFRSVKEAVMLFGERVLASELYANKLKEMQDETNEEEGAIAELEETKQSLQKAKEESIQMSKCLTSLQQELEQTKRELHHLKFKSNLLELQQIDRDLEFVDDRTKNTAVRPVETFQKKKYVTFANPPAIIPPPPAATTEAVLQRHPSLKKKKKQQLLPLIGRIFSRKKGTSHHDHISFA